MPEEWAKIFPEQWKIAIKSYKNKHDFNLLLLKVVLQAQAIDSLAVTCGQETCGYYNVTDKIGVLEQSPRLMNIRPVNDWREPTTVSVDMTFRAVLELDEKLQIMTTLMDLEMIWENQFLSWDPEEFCGINCILIPEGSVWVPDINILEITEDDSIDVLYMQLYYNGTIRRVKTLNVVTTCALDLYKFPFDIQKCNLTFGLSMNKVSDVLLIPSSSAEQVTSLSLEEFSKSEWTLKEINIIHLNITKYGEEWSKVIYQILIRRAPVLYVINLIIPACLLVLVDVASMFIPMEGGERLGFKITVVLGFSVLLLILNDFLPNTDNPPILGVFCMVCLLVMIISIMDSIFISYMLHLSAVRPEVPNWLKLWVLKRLAYVLRIAINDEISDSMTRAVKNNAMSETPALHESEPETNKQLSKDSKDSPEIKLLKRLLLELLMVRRHLIVSKKEEEAKSEWHLVAFVLDRFILILYLFIVTIIIVIVVLVWAM
ncbi:5-hydroxytryptamine receptor 3A-like [Hyla sarda]|uniref:5-hydroxytryptamine receptor 3A-like n=1 Tax=Hyla sarda TaxID=327740 RepID=UPI0024C22A46|nr:5-hydroxytryptamine receptor 3A-like [Hyla sarda]